MNYKTLLLLSIYHTESLDLLHTFLQKIEEIPPIMISINKDKYKSTSVDNFLNIYAKNILHVSQHSNYGVDINPFLKQLSLINSDEFPFVIKLHSKNSKWGTKQHVDWGRVLYHSLIGSNNILKANLNIIKKEHVGMISHPFLTLNHREINNSQKINHLCSILNIEYAKVKNQYFAAGSMFLSKSSLLKKYFTPENIKYIDTLLSNEIGKVDDRDYANGTYSHSLERIFGYIIHAENKIIHKAILPSIRIKNAQYRGNLHLITIGDIVYIEEDLNLYGNIIFRNNMKIVIHWLHVDQTLEYQNHNGYYVRQ